MFYTPFKPYVCEGDSIRCTVNGLDAIATVYRDDCQDRPDEIDDGFWPSHEKDAAGYVLPENFAAEYAKAEKVMAAWRNDEWFYCGVAVTIEKNGILLTHKYGAALWGIECNYPGSDNEYLLKVANELLPEALAEAEAALQSLCESHAQGGE